MPKVLLHVVCETKGDKLLMKDGFDLVTVLDVRSVGPDKQWSIVVSRDVGVTYVDGMYFRNEDEAAEWLEFDAGENEREEAANATPDQFAEWRQWQAAWDERHA